MLNFLNCYTNKITELDLSTCKSIARLFCQENQLTKIDLSTASNLKELSIDKNMISCIDASNSPNLTYLSCNNNKISSINITGCSKLNRIFCFANDINAQAAAAISKALPDCSGGAPGRFYFVDKKELNEKNTMTQDQADLVKKKNWLLFDNNGGGRALDYMGEKATVEDNCKEMIHFTIGSERTTLSFFPMGDGCWIDLNANGVKDDGEALSAEEGSRQNITLAQERNLTLYGKKIIEFRVDEQMDITSIDASKCTSLELIWVVKNDLSEVKLPINEVLENIDFSECKLSGEWDFSPYTHLEEIFIPSNKISAIKLGNLPLLRVLSIGENKISAIDLSGCPSLKEFYCPNNKISSLDCSMLSNLEILSVFHNQIKKDAMENLIDGFNSNEPKSMYNPKNFNVLEVNDDGKPTAEEGNEITEDLIKKAIEKKWTVKGWKVSGGLISLGTNSPSIAEENNKIDIMPTGNGWRILCKKSISNEPILLYSLRGEFINRYEQDSTINIEYNDSKALLRIGKESYILIH